MATQASHDYLPACGHDRFLPFYDLLGKALGVPRLHRALLELAELGTAERVLEIGCGTGNLAIMASRMYPAVEVVGVDPDPLALARATRKAAGAVAVRFERGYAQDLPYPDGAFDRVLSALMLHHLDAELKPVLLAQARRVLRPGGALHLMDLGGRVTEADGFVARRQLRGPHLRGQLGDQLPDALRAAGFTDVTEQLSRNTRFGRITFYRAAG